MNISINNKNIEIGDFTKIMAVGIFEKLNPFLDWSDATKEGQSKYINAVAESLIWIENITNNPASSMINSLKEYSGHTDKEMSFYYQIFGKRPGHGPSALGTNRVEHKIEAERFALAMAKTGEFERVEIRRVMDNGENWLEKVIEWSET